MIQESTMSFIIHTDPQYKNFDTIFISTTKSTCCWNFYISKRVRSAPAPVLLYLCLILDWLYSTFKFISSTRSASIFLSFLFSFLDRHEMPLIISTIHCTGNSVSKVPLFSRMEMVMVSKIKFLLLWIGVLPT